MLFPTYTHPRLYLPPSQKVIMSHVLPGSKANVEFI